MLRIDRVKIWKKNYTQKKWQRKQENIFFLKITNIQNLLALTNLIWVKKF